MNTPAPSQELEYVPCEICQVEDSEFLFVVEQARVVRCRRCGLAYVNPRPGASSLQRGYSEPDYFHKDIFSSRADQEQLENPLSWDRHRFQLLASGCSPGRLLDVGCGTGRFMLQAQQNGWQAVGLEFNPHGAELARQATCSEVFVGTAEHGSVLPGSFDAVSLLHVLEHVPHPRHTLRAIHRLLRSNGRLLIEVPDFSSPNAQRAREHWVHVKPKEHIYYFDLRTLRSLLRLEGFRIRKVRRTGGLGRLGSSQDPRYPARWARPLYALRGWLAPTPGLRNMLRYVYWDVLRQHDNLLVLAEKTG